MTPDLRALADRATKHADYLHAPGESGYHQQAYHLREYAAALRSAADQLDAQKAEIERQWQPIEVAPHNTRVLVYYENPLGNGRRIIATYYDEETLDSEWTESEWAEAGWYEESYANDEIYPVEYEPTHWMSLPKAPT